MHVVSATSSPTVVTCRVADTEFALSADILRDTLENVQPTRVPGAHGWYDGILPWHGQLVPVLNVARRLGLEPGSGAVVLVIDAGSECVGLRVDALTDDVGSAPTLELASLLTAPVDNVSAFPKAGRSKGRSAESGRRGVKRA